MYHGIFNFVLQIWQNWAWKLVLLQWPCSTEVEKNRALPELSLSVVFRNTSLKASPLRVKMKKKSLLYTISEFKLGKKRLLKIPLFLFTLLTSCLHHAKQDLNLFSVLADSLASVSQQLIVSFEKGGGIMGGRIPISWPLTAPGLCKLRRPV